MLNVSECFKSLQGESTFAGLPCFFIRLAGCNLDCNYCDSVYAREVSRTATVAELAELAAASQVSLVEVTGGEPLAQKETPELVQLLLDKGFTVLLETNGSLPVDLVSDQCHRIVDRKLPGSGMAAFHDDANYRKLTPRDEVKFVVSDENDFDFAVREIEKFSLDKIGCPLLVSPVWGRIDFKLLAEKVLASPYRMRMQLQMHKLIWGDVPGV
ncbi:MAG: radical SAM protein [Victivallaceae bacterium]|nr:radical SAM protein [Victivallaceae bacterium]